MKKGKATMTKETAKCKQINLQRFGRSRRKTLSHRSMFMATVLPGVTYAWHIEHKTFKNK